MRQLAPQLRIRPLLEADLPRVMEIENQAFSNPWSQDMVKKEFSQEWSLLLAVDEAAAVRWELRAFAIVWVVHDELHLLNLATHRDHRRRGLGRFLLSGVLDAGRARGCRLATLEVRRSNQAALALYGAFGFRAVGMRPNYYVDDREDAVVMIRDLPG